jgi:hypothetical protein
MPGPLLQEFTMPDEVNITLIDAGSGQVLGMTAMAAGALPESFLQATTLHIGGDEWSVQSAEPPLRSQFAATGELVLTLARIERLDPQTILYSLPTINDRLSGEAGQADGTEVVLMEDDWRQVEFVHASCREIVEEELRDIRRIHDAHRRDIGFETIHLRSRLPEVLAAAGLGASVLPELVPGSSRPLRFASSGARIAGGFAYELAEGWLLYGVAVPPLLETLGLHAGSGALPAPQIAALEKLAQNANLLLVDWCRCTVAEPAAGTFGRLLAGTV